MVRAKILLRTLAPQELAVMCFVMKGFPPAGDCTSLVLEAGEPLETPDARLASRQAVGADLMPSQEKIGLIAGNGKFPFLVLDAARAQGYDVVVAAIREEAFAEIESRTGRLPFTGFRWANCPKLIADVPTGGRAARHHGGAKCGTNADFFRDPSGLAAGRSSWAVAHDAQYRFRCWVRWRRCWRMKASHSKNPRGCWEPLLVKVGSPADGAPVP